MSDAKQILLDQVKELEDQMSPGELLSAISILMVMYSGHYGVSREQMLTSLAATWDVVSDFEQAIEAALLSPDMAAEA